VRDDLTLCSCNDGRIVDKKEGDKDEDENDMENTSTYEKSGVRLDRLRLEAPVSVILPAGSGLVPAISGMVN